MTQPQCAHDWMQRGSWDDRWRECFLCGKQEAAPAEAECACIGAYLCSFHANAHRDGVAMAESCGICGSSEICDHDVSCGIGGCSFWAGHVGEHTARRRP